MLSVYGVLLNGNHDNECKTYMGQRTRIFMTAGIYKIESADGKVYIGSAVNIDRRWQAHKYELRRKTHHSQHLQNAWNKHGEEYFTFSIIELVADKSRLLYYEQIWLDILFQSLERDEIYNIAIIAGSSLGVKRSEEFKQRVSEANKGNKYALGLKHSDETKAKMAEAQKGNKHALGYKASDETKARISAANKGKKLSDETKRKMSEAKKGKKYALGVKRSDETKAKMAEAKAKTYTFVSPDGILTTITNLSAFCREHGLNQSHLHGVYICKRRSAKGWTNPECNKGKDINE
jgi:group I intron endonuclease